MKKAASWPPFALDQIRASGYEEIYAVSRLRRRIADRAAAGDALARRQRRAALDVLDEEVERALRMRLDELQLREDSCL